MFEQLNNDPGARRIQAAAEKDALSHALLFTGGDSPVSLARFAAAAMECTAPSGQPCGVCPACRKVAQDIHPDVITVRDPEHKNLSVDVVRAIRSDAYIRPNEGRRKVYIFPDCALLTEQDQNVLLKIVEEGPPYAAFLFCAEHPSQVLQTLRSRCVEVKLHPGEAGDGELSEASRLLCQAVGSRRRGAVAETAVRLERRKMDRDALSTMLANSHATFAAALLLLYGHPAASKEEETAAFLAKNLTKSQIMFTIEVLQKYHGECAYNVGVGHVLGALAAELEGIL